MAALKACSALALALAAVGSALVMPPPDLARGIGSSEKANVAAVAELSSHLEAATDGVVLSGSESAIEAEPDKILSGGFACPFLSCHPVRPLDYVVQFDWSECRLYETPINRVDILAFADDVLVKEGAMSLYSFGGQAHKVAAYSDAKVDAIGAYGITCCGEFLGFLQEDTCSPTVHKGKRIKCLKPFPKPPGEQQDSGGLDGGFTTCPYQDDDVFGSDGAQLRRDQELGLPPCDATMDPKEPCLPSPPPLNPSQERQEPGDELKRDLTANPEEPPLCSRTRPGSPCQMPLLASRDPKNVAAPDNLPICTHLHPIEPCRPAPRMNRRRRMNGDAAMNHLLVETDRDTEPQEQSHCCSSGGPGNHDGA